MEVIWISERVLLVVLASRRSLIASCRVVRRQVHHVVALKGADYGDFSHVLGASEWIIVSLPKGSNDDV